MNIKRTHLLKVVLTFLLIALISCRGNKNQNRTEESGTNIPPVIEVRAADYTFQAPDSISSGWTTLRLINEEGMEIHELGLAKLPDGKTLNDYMNEVIPVWDSVLTQLQNGEIEASDIGVKAYKDLPEWNSDIHYIKSRGLISPGHQTENIMYLEPGTYMIECWVKNAEGKIHISNGMIRQLTVIEENTDAVAPEYDYQISLTGNGIETKEELSRGKHIVAVDFEVNEDVQILYDDVHLIHVDEETDFEAITEWLGWYQVGGLRAPAPAEFLGGVDVYGSLPYGKKAYFSIDIVPGTYAWIVDAPVNERVWKEFTVE